MPQNSSSFLTSFSIGYPTCSFFKTRAMEKYSKCCLFCSWSLGEPVDIHWGTSSLYRLSFFTCGVSLIFPLVISISIMSNVFLNLLCLCIRTKALLFTLIRAFEIDLAVSPTDLGSRATSIQRPILLTDPNNSNQMPLLVRPVSSNL
jgi:hypothetical protein